MLWSDNLTYDFELDDDGSLLILRNSVAIIKRRLQIAGILFVPVIIGLVLTKMFPSFRGVIALIAFLSAILSLIIIWVAPVKFIVGETYRFDIIKRGIFVNQTLLCRFEDINAISINWIPDHDSGNTRIAVNGSDTFEVVIYNSVSPIEFYCYNEGLVATIIADKISSACGIHYHLEYDGKQSETRFAQAQNELYEFETFLQKYSTYTDVQLKERIDLQKFSNNLAYEAAATTLRNRKNKKG